MGFFAGSLGGNDTNPHAAFDLPPATLATGTVEGTVTDASGDPVAGVPVTLLFQGSGVANPTDVTDSTAPTRCPGYHAGTTAIWSSTGRATRRLRR